MYGVVIACLMKSVIWSYSAQLNEHRPASEVQGLSSQRLYTILGAMSRTTVRASRFKSAIIPT